jgi:hypothetical protein
MKVYSKLMKARLALQNTKLKKSGQNKFAGYSYFELGDFLPTVQNIFSEVGLCGIVSFQSDLATLTITDTEDGSQIVITSPMGSAALKGCHEVQNIGAVETYQRRYLWVSAMEIVEHDILDSLHGKGVKNEEDTNSYAEKGSVRHTPRGGIGDDLPEETKEYLRDLAAASSEMVEGGKAVEALALIDAQALESDQKVWMASQMSSSTRAALKKAKIIPTA